MGRKAKSEILIYEGRRYTWCAKGYWRCTAKGDRHNLARRMWEQHHGPIPPGEYVFYKDGNRFNVSPANLGCSSRSDRMKELLSDPDRRMMFKACGFYGLLMNQINEALKPELKRARYARIVESRRAGDNYAAARKSWKKRCEPYGPSGCKYPALASKHIGEAKAAMG
jgi:hypothetical protein